MSTRVLRVNTRMLRAAAAPIASMALLAGIGAGAATAAPEPPKRPFVSVPKPSAQELNNNLAAALAPNGSKVESNSTAGLVTIKNTTSRLPGYNWQVLEPVAVNGDRAVATLNSCMPPMGCYPIKDVSWKYLGGEWKLSKESEELLVGYAKAAPA